MTMTPHISLSFNGQCEAAFKFYERCLGAKIATMFKYGDSPMAAEAPVAWRDKVLHASLTVGEGTVLGSDTLPHQYERPKGFAVLLQIDDDAEAERVLDALSENGTVKMAIQKTFWASRFGVLTDQFGIPWTINCEDASVSEP